MHDYVGMKGLSVEEHDDTENHMSVFICFCLVLLSEGLAETTRTDHNLP